ncbi:acyl-CoA carboxylase subunit beta [Sulfobacillus harzensis]|uniref:Acyl-CoA carboxylase subunit beta n=1 Tax=Sulfobacillus harzensis TaxID=2729629 RepID=A0A7Y0Q2C1_9FIRM|nr:acyl-CoA carboxylase subunit beta [Sulfobacillus harzensis]NMP23043.1 acyl-CoA carboxylase subunit beta [Sulfobacillus harzensis]
MKSEELRNLREQLSLGGPEKYRKRLPQEGKLPVRERIARLLDPGWVEDGLLANNLAGDLAADGVVTVTGSIDGRTVVVMANDPTVKAGSWGARTVEKIIRIQEKALDLNCPIFYLVDSAGARITDQVEMFPGRRGAGRIFYNQIKLSGRVPQVCLLFGPSAAGGAYIPAFTDIVIMVDKNASMYLGSPRMAEMVIGEKVTLEEMGGARMHCTVSGVGDLLAESEEQAIDWGRQYFRYMPDNWESAPPAWEPEVPAADDWTRIIPENQNVPFDMNRVIERIVDRDSWFSIKPLFAPEILTGLARIDGRPVGIVANQSKVKGGVLFVDSADKAARFINLCDAFNIPLIFLADVPGFMIGTKVEREGIIRHGAKLIAAVSEATVPKISVVVRKAYGAGLYAMAGPAFGSDVTIALPTAQIAVMGPEAAVNAVYFNRIQELEGDDRRAFVQQKQQEYREDIDIRRLAAELVVDEVIVPEELRRELSRRLKLYAQKSREFSRRRHPVTPV